MVSSASRTKDASGHEGGRRSRAPRHDLAEAFRSGTRPDQPFDGREGRRRRRTRGRSGVGTLDESGGAKDRLPRAVTSLDLTGTG